LTLEGSSHPQKSAKNPRAEFFNTIVTHCGHSINAAGNQLDRGPPLWEMATAAEQARNDPQWDAGAEPGPEIEFDQRIVR